MTCSLQRGIFRLLCFVPPGLWVTTEFGRLHVQPSEILVLPQGVRFSISLPDGPSRGYVCEVFGGHFQLPDLGPIGRQGMAQDHGMGVDACLCVALWCRYVG